MRRFSGTALVLVVLAAAGFAVASIASGANPLHALTWTTSTTPRWTTGTVGGGGGRRVTICHRTHSRKHPGVTITVSWHALKAHLRHGDTLGACAPDSTWTVTTTDTGDKHGKKGDSGNHGHDHGHGQGSEHGKNGK
jgi:hypothetical protein